MNPCLILRVTQSRQGVSIYSISSASIVYTGEHLLQQKRLQLPLLQWSGTKPTVSPRFACKHNCKQQNKLSLILISSNASGICPFRDRPKVSQLDGIILKCSLGIYLGFSRAFHSRCQAHTTGLKASLCLRNLQHE